jgi:hypothetical protein
MLLPSLHSSSQLQQQEATAMPGKYMLQLDEVVNISAGFKDR